MVAFCRKGEGALGFCRKGEGALVFCRKGGGTRGLVDWRWTGGVAGVECSVRV